MMVQGVVQYIHTSTCSMADSDTTNGPQAVGEALYTSSNHESGLL